MEGAQQPRPPQQTARVTVTDIDMPFWSMVRFMVKWAVAAIPALVLLLAAAFGAGLIFGPGYNGVAPA